MATHKPLVLVFCSAFCCAGFLFSATSLAAQEASPVVVLRDAGMLAADSPAFSQQLLEQALPKARFAPAEQLATALSEPATRLLVLPYGSAFPEETWPAIHAFLERGGNLLVLGGRPFTRAAYHDS